MLNNLKKSSKSQQEKQDDYRARISQHLGGGQFQKMNKL